MKKRWLPRAMQVPITGQWWSNLPPHADALRRSTGLPVHHLMTLVHERWSLMT